MKASHCLKTFNRIYPVCFLKGLVLAGVLATQDSNVDKVHVSLQHCGCFKLLSYIY